MARPAPMRHPTRLPATRAAAAVALAAISLGACGVTRTAFGPLQYDKTSPAAGAIASTDVSNQPYPTFAQVPSQPDDVRPTSAWNRNIFDTLAARRQMEALQVVQPQTLYGAEAFAQQARAEAAPPLTAAQSKAESDQSAAIAKEGRARAKPPSPAP
ncbi:MAG: hypothetical protein ACXWKT_11360 [Caulobacteraceae bacterium]